MLMMQLHFFGIREQLHVYQEVNLMSLIPIGLLEQVLITASWTFSVGFSIQCIAIILLVTAISWTSSTGFSIYLITNPF